MLGSGAECQAERRARVTRSSILGTSSRGGEA